MGTSTDVMFCSQAGIVPAVKEASLRASFGALLAVFDVIYGYAWFVGFFVGAGLYLTLMRDTSKAAAGKGKGEEDSVHILKLRNRKCN